MNSTVAGRACSIAGCTKKHYGKGFCVKHYHRDRRHGDTSAVHHGHRYQEVDPMQRILDNSTKQGDCLVFNGKATNRSGHKQMSFRGRMTGAHRVMWILTVGPIAEGLCVCHRCDNPPCVNIDHLFLGTVRDNNADRDAKGRGKMPRPDQRVYRQPGPTVHGTLSAYVKRGCRCEDCRRANSEYRSKKAARPVLNGATP
jgi:hypothetical protein